MRHLRWAGTSMVVAALLASPLASAEPTAAANASSYVGVLQTAVSAGLAIHPLDLAVLAYDVNGTPLLAGTTPGGYKPKTVQGYLGLSGNGSGQTIAIVDAYDDPNIAADLATFDQTFALPAPPSFKKLNQKGGTTYPKSDGGWALEISLDVEWAHALAPAASIVLVEANSSAFTDMDTAIAYATKQSGVAVISNSWGSAEFNGETTIDSYCKLTTAVCTFSTGDTGNPGTYPANSPYVLAVGGTTLNLATDATTGAVSVTSEAAWSGSGGDVSAYEAKPAYQNAVNTKANRGVPDVSYDADPATGFATYDSVPYQSQTGWFQMGGTSAGAPQWAAIIAVADQARKSAGKSALTAWTTASTYKAHSTIYGLTSGLADITTGTNGTCGSVCTASAGYDFVTGRGSPRKGIDTALAAAA